MKRLYNAEKDFRKYRAAAVIVGVALHLLVVIGLFFYRDEVPAPGETTGSANLSDQLSRSNGVICPPVGVDQGISAPPSGVLPLPGTPGGDPNVVPK